MASDPEVRRWPVLAWIRLRVPPPDTPLQLTRGPPPPPLPPLEALAPESVATDPSVRLYTLYEPLGGAVLRYAWTAADPGALTVEYRAERFVSRLPPDEVRRFWSAVKARIAEIGPLPVEAADPRP